MIKRNRFVLSACSGVFLAILVKGVWSNRDILIDKSGNFGNYLSTKRTKLKLYILKDVIRDFFLKKKNKFFVEIGLFWGEILVRFLGKNVDFL